MDVTIPALLIYDLPVAVTPDPVGPLNVTDGATSYPEPPEVKVIIPTTPSGLCIINNLNSESKILKERFEQIVSEYKQQELSYEQLNIEKFELGGIYPNLFPNDWQKIVEQLSLSTATY